MRGARPIFLDNNPTLGYFFSRRSDQASGEMKMKATHTSLTDFESFDAAFIGSSTGHTGICAGFFFSINRCHSSHKSEGEHGRWITYEVELTVQNPARAKSYAAAEEQWGEGVESVAALVSAGHDALIIADGDEIVVWDTSKIRIISKR